MTPKLEIGDQEEMREAIKTLIETAKNSPNGNDPRVLEILDNISKESEVVKIYGWLNKLIPLLAEGLGDQNSTEEKGY